MKRYLGETASHILHLNPPLHHRLLLGCIADHRGLSHYIGPQVGGGNAEPGKIKK